MKNLLLILFGMTYITTLSMGQNFMKLLINQDYESISQYTNDKVNIEIDRKKTILSSDNAIRALKTKLSDFNTKKWSNVHNGKSKENDARYLIAEVYNTMGESLRVFFYLESIENVNKIYSIRVRNLLN